MRLLDRYILRELLIPLFYCLSGFLLFWLSFDLFTSLADFQSRHLTIGDILEYYVIKLPDLLTTVLPIALLLALLYALTNHARSHELTAMRSAGISVWRFALPYFFTGIAFSGLLYGLNEFFVSDGNEAAEQVLNRHEAGHAANQDWKENINFRNINAGRIWNITAFNTKTGELRSPHIEWALGNGQSMHLMARSATRTNDAWAFHDVHKLVYQAGEDFPRERLFTNLLVIPELTETPQEINIQAKFSRLSTLDAAKKAQLSIREIQYLRTHLALNARDRALLNTQFQARAAAPWTCVVVVLIALPFGALSGRRNAFVGVAASIGICFVFFLLMRFGLALGTGGYMPPWLAAWLPNILFGTLGLGLSYKLR